MSTRLHGTIDGLADSDQRTLRPIGASVREVAARTGALLDRLRGTPGVWLFAGVQVTAGSPPIPYVVSCGRDVLLVESVAWPGGRYTTTPEGDVLCDGTYIGQSVRSLVGSVRWLRRMLPHPHRVGAVIVVYPADDDKLALPPVGAAELTWLTPSEVTAHLGRRLRREFSVVRPRSAVPARDYLLSL